MAKDDANILDDPYRARKMKVRSVTTQEWQEFVESLPDYSFFQLPTWAQVHEKAFAACEVATKLFTFDDDVQVLLPLVKTKHKFGFETLESLPWGWYGGFVWRKKPSEAQIRQILGHLLTWRVLHLGIYPGPWDAANRALLENGGLEKKLRFTHVLELLAGHQWLWENRLHATCKNRVRKAIKSGVTITPVNDAAQIKTYYDIYLDSARRWGLPESQVIPLAYFESLFQLGGDRVKCHLARYDNKYISGCITAYDSSGCSYLQGAMLEEYGQYCPNNLLFNEIIKDVCARGCRSFNFGGSEGLSPGVQTFKETWGAEKLDYTYFVHDSPLLRLYKKVRTLAPFRKRQA